MNNFPSTQRYSRLADNGYTNMNENGVGQSWVSVSPPLNQDSSYEMHNRAPAKPISSVFAEELSSSSSPRYAPVSDESEFEGTRGLAEEHIGAGRVNTGYNPLFTRRWVILCFALLWILIIVVLQILYSVSQSQKGLATTRNSLRYLWTYGPTAFLVVITIMWRQVDYATKYVQPWAELAKGPLPANRTLLLDYITPFQIVAFGRSLKLKHITVGCTILIFVLIKVLTVISTGLLTLEVIEFEGKAQSMRASTVFDGSKGLPLDSIDSRAAVGLYGSKTYNMLLPNGTTELFAYQLFEPDVGFPNDTYAYNASVDVFTADGWECETGDLTYDNATDHNPVGDGTGYAENTPVMTYYNTSVTLPGCQIHNGHLDAPSWYWVQNDTVPRFGYWGIFHNVNCSNLAATDPNVQRYMISVAYSKGIGQNDNIMLNSSNIVCRPSYSIQPGYVNIFTNGTLNGNITLSGTKRLLDGISTDDLARAVYRTLVKANIPADVGSDNVTADAFLADMINRTPDFRYDMLMDPAWLTNKSKESYQQHAAQVAGIYLLSASDSSTLFPGTIARNELRLVVKNLPTRLMQAFAATMLVLSIVMLFTMPQNVVPRSVESLAAIAVILARSPSLVQVLQNTGHLDIHALTYVLGRHRYMSTVADAPHGKTFSIRVISDAEPQSPINKQQTRIKWIRPVVLRRVVMILTLLLAVGVFIALEVLYRYSEQHNGIADVNVESLEKYAWIYTPVVVLVLLATTFNLLDFELEFADPYHELARGYTAPTTSVFWDPLRNLTPKTCIEAFQHSRFALVASSISVLFAPMLTIAVSGLLTARSVPHTSNSSPSTETWFNISSDYYADNSESNSFAIPALILQGNMSYPQWTQGELAFPSIDLSTKSTGIANVTDGIFQIETPAARGSVNCTLVPENEYNNLTVGPDTYSCEDCITYNITAVNGCGNSGDDRGMIWSTGYTDIPTSGTGYFGKVDFGWGTNFDSTTNETTICPSFLVSFGNVDKREIKKWSLYYCYSGFETVRVNATVSANLATIIDEPQVLADTTQVFADAWKPATDSFNGGPYFAPINFTHPDEVFDPYFNVMVYGKDGVPREELLQDDTLVKQFTHTYRQWAAQWLSSHMRSPISDLAKNATNTAGTLPQTVKGVYQNPNRQRLFLTDVSTRILQGIIGILLICGVIILFLVDMSEVLPKPVGSIGAVASLLAGSRLIDERSGLIPRGSEWLSDEEMKRRRMWEGEMFRMGWWTNYDGKDPLLNNTAYPGAAGEIDETEASEKNGQFRIDARPRLMAFEAGK